MAIQKLSRAEVNKHARRILQQHHVKMSEISCSCSPRSVSISGLLMKGSGKDFVIKEIENLYSGLRDIKGVINVKFDVANWNISEGGISLKEKKEEKGKEKEANKPEKEGGGEENDPSKAA